MTAIRVPGTDRIVFVANHIGDVVFDMKDFPEVDSSIANEDIKIIGSWEDYTGSKIINSGEVIYQGIQNISPETLKGQVEQSDIQRTDRGKKTATMRQRSKLIYINLDGGTI